VLRRARGRRTLEDIGPLPIDRGPRAVESGTNRVPIESALRVLDRRHIGVSLRPVIDLDLRVGPSVVALHGVSTSDTSWFTGNAQVYGRDLAGRSATND
jgi:hypothetical protein